MPATMQQSIVEQVLGANGTAVASGCRYRPQQEQASRFIRDALQNGHHACLEAATGVGKSYAYLVPAIEAAQSSKVVISTATINLQDQLILKDIPAVETMTGLQADAVLVKGRSNYLSLRRLANTMHELGSYPQHLIDELVEIEGLVNSGIGEKDGFSVPPSNEAWALISSTKDDCMGRKCAHFAQCPFHQARRDQHSAGILVVNHALLCADLKLRDTGFSLLPEYDAVIVDEAHEFPNAASRAFGDTLSRQQIKYLLKSVLQRVQGTVKPATYSNIQTYVENMSELLDLAFEMAHKAAENGLKTPLQIKLADMLHEMGCELRRAAGGIQDEEKQMEVLMVARRCQSSANTFRDWSKPHEDFVSFSEKSRNNVTLTRAPIFIREHMQETLLKTPSVVMTSATLGTGQGLQFFKSEVGMDSASEMQIGSPFDYPKNVTLTVDRTMPDPRDAGYTRALIKAVKDAILKSDGGNLVLFTSYYQMNDVAKAVRPWAGKNGYTFLCQGREISRKQIVDTMKSDDRCVVFGTDSFWQGVDVPGRNLRSVVITKLPFRMPDSPVLKRRFELLEKDGLNPFFHYSLPEATIKLKQGFGRLIRNETDQGDVLILDSRVVTKSYGKQMLAALPKCRGAS